MTMRGLFRLTVVVALLAVGPAAAQSTLDELARASELMQAADKLFRDRAVDHVVDQVLGRAKEPPPTEQALDNAYRQISESISIFVRVAPRSRIDDALEAAQKAYEGAHLPKPPNLLAAAEDCDRRRDPMLARYLTGILWLKFSLTHVNAEAEAKLGPMVDNPAFYASIRPPVTGADLLVNLKWALDHDALVREDFFPPSTLRQFLGVDVKLQRFVNGSVSAFAVVRPTAAEIESLDAASRRYSQCTYQAGRNVKAAGKASSFVDIRCTYRRAGMPSFEDVEHVFGERGRDKRPMLPRSPHAGPLPPATAPHANQTVLYDFGDAGMKRSLLVEFALDARFGQLHLTAEEQ